MGTDKAALVVDGTAMVDRVLQAVAKAGITKVVIVGPGHVADPEPGQGPMAGIAAGWTSLRADAASVWDPVVVLACDLPRLDASVVRALIRAAQGHEHGAVADDGTRRQPLVAAYRAAALDELDAAYRAGERSVRKLFAGWDLAERHVDATRVADADTPEDLRGFRVEWPS